MRGGWTVTVTAALLHGVVAAAPGNADVAARALDFVQQQREKTGAPPLERREDLDRVAAARIHTLRIRRVPGDSEPGLERDGALGPLLAAEGIGSYRAVYEYLDVRRAHTRGQAMARLWRSQPEAWGRAMDPEADSIGIATARTDDHWLLFVAVLLDETEPRDLDALARDTFERVNRLRGRQGLPPLRPHAGDPAQAPRRATLRARYRGPGDAVGAAIEIWSRDPLRADLLDPAFSHATVEVSGSDGDDVRFVLVLIELPE